MKQIHVYDFFYNADQILTSNFFHIEINEEIASAIILGTSYSRAVNSRINIYDPVVHRPRSAVAQEWAPTFGISSDSSSFFQEPSDYSCRLRKTTFDERAKHNDQEVFCCGYFDFPSGNKFIFKDNMGHELTNYEILQFYFEELMRKLELDLVETKRQVSRTQLACLSLLYISLFTRCPFFR